MKPLVRTPFCIERKLPSSEISIRAWTKYLYPACKQVHFTRTYVFAVPLFDRFPFSIMFKITYRIFPRFFNLQLKFLPDLLLPDQYVFEIINLTLLKVLFALHLAFKAEIKQVYFSILLIFSLYVKNFNYTFFYIRTKYIRT